MGTSLCQDFSRLDQLAQALTALSRLIRPAKSSSRTSKSSACRSPAATARLLHAERHGLSGDYPVDRGDQGQMTPPMPNPQAQRATTRDLEQENQESGMITGNY
jgi:hypothetical protein